MQIMRLYMKQSFRYFDKNVLLNMRLCYIYTDYDNIIIFYLRALAKVRLGTHR